MEATLSTKGQVVIPAALRRRLGLVAGTQLVFREEDGRLVVEKAQSDDPVGRALGAARVQASDPTTTDAWMDELRGGREP
jgi:antitoxin PrlF